MQHTQSISSPSIVVIQNVYQSLIGPSGSVESECYPASDDERTVRTVNLPDLSNIAIWLASDASIHETENSSVESIVDHKLSDWLAFQRLVQEWRTQRGAASSITEAVLCPAYQSIIGMGKPVVPFLIQQLQMEGDDPDQWFWALSAITRAQPVDDSDRGNYRRMAKVWLEWAEREDYAG